MAVLWHTSDPVSLSRMARRLCVLSEIGRLFSKIPEADYYCAAIIGKSLSRE